MVQEQKSPIVAKKVVILQKKGMLRLDYTHVTKFEIRPDDNLGPVLFIAGETGDVDGTRIKTYDKFLLENLEMTVIEWYIPT